MSHSTEPHPGCSLKCIESWHDPEAIDRVNEKKETHPEQEARQTSRVQIAPQLTEKETEPKLNQCLHILIEGKPVTT